MNDDKEINLYQLNWYIEQFSKIFKKKLDIRNDANKNKYEKKVILEDLQEDENEIKSHIMKGIPINDDDLRSRIINIIINFLKSYGYLEESIISNLSDIKLFTTSVNLIDDSTLMTVGNNIYIDYGFVIFDESGQFKCFNEKDIIFLEYGLTHEFFHKYSAFRKDKQLISIKDDALSEGFTDMFALMATGGYEYRSKKYDFLVRICMMLSNIIGIEKTLDDYINNIDSWPNLKMFFNQVGLNEYDFIQFHNKMNEILALTFDAKKNKDLIPVLEKNQRQLTEFILNNILNPFIRNNPDRMFELTELFNDLFINYDDVLVKQTKFSK